MSTKGMTLLELKMRAKAKEEDEKAKAARKRNLLVLILDFFSKNGYIESMDRLQAESTISLQKWQAADNVDLNSVMQEFESFYELKYGRPPRLVRPATNDDLEEMEKAIKANKRKTSAPLPNLPSGMGSTPSAIPQAYRSNYSAVDGYQGNGMDSATGMTNSNGGSIEQQSLSGATVAKPGQPTTATPGANATAPPKDRRGVQSAKGSKAEKVAAAIALDQQITTSQTGRIMKSDKKEKPTAKEKLNASPAPLEFSIQGNNSANLTAAAATAAASSSAQTPSTTTTATPGHPARSPSMSFISSSSKRPSQSPSRRAESPDPEELTAPSDGKDHASYYETRILKPMPEYADSQFRELAHIITRDIYSENPNVRWTDIAELEEAKQLLKEAVVMPLKFPQFFTGLLSPWKGVLLYGPPGTGKTMLARAVATECQTTFFNISASSIVSKFRGDSEKLVRVLFELARYHAPSTIFIDEIDSIMGRRDAAGEHEGSRRMKTELLIQMDGLSKSDDLVFVLAASNLPWDLDIALLRRLEKRILVPLPNERARLTMIKGHLPEGERASGLDYNELARKTEGYSGSDIALLCKEAAMRPVRRLMKLLLTVESVDKEVSSEVKLDPVVEADVRSALACTRPSAQSKFLSKYTEWHAAYGAGMNEIDMGETDGK